MRLPAFMILLVASSAFAADQKMPDKLVVHEWGTFTSLQDEAGRTVGSVNVDDEALPPFVHRLEPELIFSKGYSEAHQDVTMRLETPVIYFYPPANADKTAPLTVTANFKGGLLSEFYPNANVVINGTPNAKAPPGITTATTSSLTWKNVQLTDAVSAPTTDSHVWISPRKVAAAPVTVGKEGERYIFYRGLGHFDAPIKVTRTADGQRITLYDNRISDRPRRELVRPMPTWLAEFRADGSCAFRTIADAPSPMEAKAKSQPGTFADADFSADSVNKLKAAMKDALLAAGLFDDEATAMLETWKVSYFKGVGQRLFFLVPREWTDQVLPLEISQPCELKRVMMGRIELITPKQRAAVTQLIDPKAKLDDATRETLTATLGRFRVAMYRDEYARQHPVAAPAAKASAE